MSKIVWSPQPRQSAFMCRPEYECLYGGAAGGGKSDAMLCEAMRQIKVPNYKGIIFRKTYPQLQELILRSNELYKAVVPQAKYNVTDKKWTFPSGAKIFFGTMQHTKDRLNYQGLAYDFIGFDELTHFTWEEYSYMFSRNRPSGPGTRVYMRATANPGGVGHAWVKDRFITAAPPETPITEERTILDPNGKKIQVKRKRIFIPSSVFDNKKLLENDPYYLDNLAMLPEAERKALLYGSWDSFSGQVFKEWRNDPEHYKDRKWTHVIEPFRIPSYWRIWRGYDYGFAKPFSVGWYAADENGKIYRIREYYGCTGEPNVGLELDPTQQAKHIREIENEDPNLKGRKIIGIADPSIWDCSRGESIAEMMEKHPNNILFSPGDNARLAGKMQYHYRMAFDEDGDTMFQVFDTCKHFIRTIPALVYSESDVEDIDTIIADKAEFITSFCEVIMKKPQNAELNGDEVSMIDLCVKDIYKKYLYNDPKPENMPTLQDFYERLNFYAPDKPAAQNIANSLQLYVTGSQNVFNHRSNVDTQNRVVCFDIRELGTTLRKAGMLIVQHMVWTRVSQNRSRRKSTRYYVDEFHLLLNQPQTANYSIEMWKRFRKWGGIITGISQNVTDFLGSLAVESIVGNSDFILMLNQHSGDQKILAEKLNISKHQISFVNNSNAGEGLLFYGNVIIPFADRYPQDTRTYALMSTKPDEIQT